MSKSLLLLKELLEEDKIDINEALEVLGYEIVNIKEEDIYIQDIESSISSLIGYEEIITISKIHK